MESKNLLIRYINAMLDIVVMFLAYITANKLKFGCWRTGIRNESNSYMTLFMIFLAAYLIVLLVFFAYDKIVERRTSEEIAAIVKLVAYMFGLVFGYIYITKTNDYYSRLQMMYFLLLLVPLLFCERQCLKHYITKIYHRSGAHEKIMLITTSELAAGVMKTFCETENWYFRIVSLAILDKRLTGKWIANIEVAADRDNLLRAISTSEIDGVYIHLPGDFSFPYAKFIEELQDMGKQVHLRIPQYELVSGPRAMQFLGKYATVTWNNKNYRIRHRAIKRAADIAFGALGVIVLIPVYVLAAAGHALEGDRGHVIVPYVRVGKGGRRFYQYRFRTLLRVKAEGGAGAKYSVTGRVLKRLGLTNLPIVWNILWGDMSLVGVAAPSVSEYLYYSKEQRKSLSMKPGAILFGPAYYWNQMEREDVTMETCEAEYVERWTIGLDVKIFIRTVLLRLKSKSYRRSLHVMSPAIEREEQRMLVVYFEEELPIACAIPSQKHKRYLYRFFKRLIDIVVSLFAIVALSPVMLVVAVLIRWEDGQNVFYRQLRIGQYGKKIYIYKFRTMLADVGDLEKILTKEQLAQYKKEFKIENDPRVTKIGGLLRKTSLDELPQLLNILKGELSLVGPRPIVEIETAVYGDRLGEFLQMKPGLTGYWQAYARNKATYASGERQAMELHYANHSSMWFDFKILLRTVIAVIRKDGAM